MDDDEDENYPDWGLFSLPYVLKAALYWVPRANLYYALCKMVDYLDAEAVKAIQGDGEGPDVGEAFDILFQYGTTGHYTPTPNDGSQPTPLSEEEIDREARAFREMLNGLRETGEPKREEKDDEKDTGADA